MYLPLKQVMIKIHKPDRKSISLRLAYRFFLFAHCFETSGTFCLGEGGWYSVYILGMGVLLDSDTLTLY